MTLPLYILAGGQSRRFGTNKALALWQNEPLICHIKTTLAPLATNVIAVSKQDVDYTDLGIETIYDRAPNMGPLMGLFTALTHAKQQDARWIWMVSCDLVMPKPEWLSPLVLHIDLKNDAVVYFQERWQPFFGLYCTTLLPQIEKQLNTNNYALQHLLNNAKTHAVSAPEGWQGTSGVNTRQALEARKGLQTP